jgi:hypothetical protein
VLEGTLRGSPARMLEGTLGDNAHGAPFGVACSEAVCVQRLRPRFRSLILGDAVGSMDATRISIAVLLCLPIGVRYSR